MKKICVFCGSRSGVRASYRAAAQAFGRALAKANLGLVYGGGRVGLMGDLADAMLAAGGYVTGVIPEFLNHREVIHTELQSCHTVTNLFERKAMMLEISDAFVALPGGIGTLDELLEVIAWRQLRQLDKPIWVLDVERFFAPWLDALRHTAVEGFVAIEELDRLLVATSVEELIARLNVGATD
ncbi:MAG: TIGR00730 family Rossman fold protein [Gammaproteobacteria bacterium]